MPTIITSAAEFVRLRSSQNPEEYLAAAWGEATDEVWLEVIEKHSDYARWVAHNKSISVNILRLLAVHPDANVRSMIASKRKTPPDVLWVLAKDEDERTRNRVAYNAKTPKEILEFLLNDPVDNIRERVHSRLEEMNRKDN